jgi:hypothetical protein
MQLAVLVTSAIALLDAGTGGHASLLGLLIAGPLLAAANLDPQRTANIRRRCCIRLCRSRTARAVRAADRPPRPNTPRASLPGRPGGGDSRMPASCNIIKRG